MRSLQRGAVALPSCAVLSFALLGCPSMPPPVSQVPDATAALARMKATLAACNGVQASDVLAGLDLTTHFLHVRLYGPRDQQVPEPRSRLRGMLAKLNVPAPA